MNPGGSAKPSPEERLLNLIRSKGRPAPAAPASAAPSAATVASPRPLGFGGFLSRESLQHWPQVAIVILSSLLCVEAGYLIYQAVRPLPLPTLPAVPSGVLQEPAHSSAGNGPQPAALLDMPSLSASASRELFVSTGTAGPSTAETGTHQLPSQLASQLVTRLSLKGIISGTPPQAIIEDAQTQKTFFVTSGQPVVEGAVLEQVLENRVILDLQGEKIELSL